MAETPYTRGLRHDQTRKLQYLRKVFSILVALTLLCTLLSCSVFAAEDATLPTIDEVLQTMTPDSGKTEVSDDLSAYDPDNYGDLDYGDFRVIILERQPPEKEFTEYDSGYPLNYQPDFPDDFTGVDIGESRVWLRCDLMNLLPDYLRATSLEDADILLIGEPQYFWAGTITVTDYLHSEKDEIPEFESIEEMEAYIAEHQPVISSITHYPKFAAYTLADLYSPVTKSCGIYDYTISYPKRFARNPDAQDLWGNMETLNDVILALSSSESIPEDPTALLAGLEDFIPQEKTAFWATCIDGGEYSSALVSMREYYWNMAGALKELDADVDHQANYDMIIEAGDANALSMFVNFCDYSGFDTPIETIRDSKEYLASPDYDWLEDTLMSVISDLVG